MNPDVMSYVKPDTEGDIEPYKFGALQEEGWATYSYSNIFERQQTTGPERLVIGPADKSHVDTLIALSRLLPEPFGILYVLLIPRGTGSLPGRYQSPAPCTRVEMEAFLQAYQEFLEGDGRHHLWVTSLTESRGSSDSSDSFETYATLVYDQHNVIYAYGPNLEVFEQALLQEQLGFTEGAVRFPVPHQHRYHAVFDAQERQILWHWDWIYFPLVEGDHL